MIRRWERPRARPLNSAAIGGHLVPLPGRAARLALAVAARPVALVRRRLALLMAELSASLDGFGRLEEVRLRIQLEELFHDRARLRSQVDDALVTVMGGLVHRRLVPPRLAHGVDVAAAHRADFGGPHA